MSKNKPLSAGEKKQLAKKRKEQARQAQKFHKEQERKARKSSEEKAAAKKKAAAAESGKRRKSKIEEAINSGKANKFEKMSREEKFRRKGEEKLRNLKPKDFENGYYIDEVGEKERQEKRAKIIQEQENEIIRRNKKPMTAKQIRRRTILFSVAILLTVLVIGVVLSFTVLFKTEKIEVEGDKYYYPDQITHFSNITLQQNVFIASMNSTPQEITKNLAYVEKAEISVAIPDTVVIRITNAVPSYVIKDGGRYLLISSKGRILEELDDNADNLTELICGDISNDKIGDYVEFNDDSITDVLDSVAKSIKNNDVDKIVGFDITDMSNIKLNYDGRIEINIGMPEDIDYKIKTAITIINQKLDPNNTETITGVLDVSTCNKNRMSHYKPGEDIVPTNEPTTAPSDDDSGAYEWSGNNYYSDGGNWDSGDYSGDNGWDSGDYSGYDTWDSGEYSGDYGW